MADKKISDLTALTGIDDDSDVLVVVDDSATETKKITVGNATASATQKGFVELATDAETIAGTDTARAVTPANIQAKVASATAKGIVELATDAETITGTDAARAVTPASLNSKTATDARIGLIELATDAETVTGTATDRATTPANIAGLIGTNLQAYDADLTGLSGLNMYYPDYSAADQGVTGDNNTIKYAVDTIAANSGTIFLRHNSGATTTTYTLSTSETIPSNINLIIENGALISIDTGITLTITGNIDTGLYKIFNCVLTGKVAGLKEASPIWFGAVVDNATDDGPAWQKAFDSILVTGGVVHIPIGKTRIDTGIIWPNAGANAYPIRLLGQNPSTTGDATGACLVTYGGAGNLFDMRNGDDSLLNWLGSIENVSFQGSSVATNVCLYVYSMKHAKLSNVQIRHFGLYGIYLASHAYYSIIDSVKCIYNGYGLYALGPNFNGTKIIRSAFSSSTNDGMYIANGGGYPVNIDSCWFEGNGRYGIRAGNAQVLNISDSYFELNVGTDIVVTNSSQIYMSIVSLNGVYFSADSTHYSVALTRVAIFNAFGCKFQAYTSGVAIGTTGTTPRGVLSGNTWPTVAGVAPISSALYGNFLWNDSQVAALGQASTRPKYHKNAPMGLFAYNTIPLKNGGIVGWLFSEPGAGSSATALALTADTTATDATVTIAANTNDLAIGCAIKIAGVDFGVNALAYAVIVDVVSLTEIELDTVANQTVVGAAVSWNTAAYTLVGGMIFGRSSASITTVGTGEDVLRTITIPAGMMESISGFKVFAAGTKTGAGGNKTLKFHFGATAVTFHVAANNTNAWRFEAFVYNTGATNTQGISWVGWDGATMLQGYDTAAIDTTAAVIMKITGECANAGDAILQKLWLVEPK